jgi:hypothetical protein
LAFLASAVDLSVDGARQHQAIVMIFDKGGRGSLTSADLRNLSIRNGDETIVDELVGKNDPAPYDAMDRVHPIHSRIASLDRTREAFA